MRLRSLLYDAVSGCDNGDGDSDGGGGVLPVGGNPNGFSLSIPSELIGETI